MKARKILKKVGILLAIVLIVSAANFIIFGAQTRMFQLPGWNVAYLYNYELYNFGDNYHELHWVDNDTISINNIVLDIHHMTYSD